MKLNELKSELKEKEKGCGRKLMHPLYCDLRSLCGKDKWQSKTIYCPTCQTKIEYIKKGISACEEILNQCQQLKSEVSENSSLSEEAQTKGIVGEFNNNVKETSVETAGNPLGFSSQSADTQTLIKQALSQGNQEILEIIDKELFRLNDKLGNSGLPELTQANLSGMYIALSSLKQQLTNSEGKE